MSKTRRILSGVVSMAMLTATSLSVSAASSIPEGAADFDGGVISQSGVYYLTKDVNALTVNEGVEATLYLNGNDVLANETYEYDEASDIWTETQGNTLYNYGSLTVYGDEAAEVYAANRLRNYGSLVLNDVRIDGGNRAIWSSGNTELNNCDVSGRWQALCLTGGSCKINGGTYRTSDVNEGDDYQNAVLLAPWNSDVNITIKNAQMTSSGTYSVNLEYGSPYATTISMENIVANGSVSVDNGENTDIESVKGCTINGDLGAYDGSIKICENTTVTGEIAFSDTANLTNVKAKSVYNRGGTAVIDGADTLIEELTTYATYSTTTINDGTITKLNNPSGKVVMNGGKIKEITRPSAITCPDGRSPEQNSDGYWVLTSDKSEKTLTVDGDFGLNISSSMKPQTVTEIKTGVTVTASDTPFMSFTGWYNGETLVSKDNKYTFDLVGDMNLYAKGEATGLVYTEYDYDNTDVFEVASEADLFGISYLGMKGYDFDGKTVKLTADIDMTQNFYPICESDDYGVIRLTDAQNFKGTFDGNGHSINNFTCEYDTNTNNAQTALIGEAQSAVIKNLTVNVNKISGKYAAVLVSWANSVQVDNCNVNGGTLDTGAANGYAGAVFAHAASGTVKNSMITGTAIAQAYKQGAVSGNTYALTVDNTKITDVSVPSIAGFAYGKESTKVTLNNVEATSKSDVFKVSENAATVTVSGDKTDLAISEFTSEDDLSAITVSGGKFTTDVKPYIADGLMATMDGDAYTVIPYNEISAEADVVTKVENDMYTYMSAKTLVVSEENPLNKDAAVIFNLMKIHADKTTEDVKVTGQLENEYPNLIGNVLFRIAVTNVPASDVLKSVQ